MFLIDDLALAPARLLLWIAEQVHDAMTSELQALRAEIIAELERLNVSLEAGEVSEEAFAECERALLDRLDQVETQIQFVSGDAAEVHESD